MKKFWGKGASSQYLRKTNTHTLEFQYLRIDKSKSCKPRSTKLFCDAKNQEVNKFKVEKIKIENWSPQVALLNAI